MISDSHLTVPISRYNPVCPVIFARKKVGAVIMFLATATETIVLLLHLPTLSGERCTGDFDG